MAALQTGEDYYNLRQKDVVVRDVGIDSPMCLQERGGKWSRLTALMTLLFAHSGASSVSTGAGECFGCTAASQHLTATSTLIWTQVNLLRTVGLRILTDNAQREQLGSRLLHFESALRYFEAPDLCTAATQGPRGGPSR